MVFPGTPLRVPMNTNIEDWKKKSKVILKDNIPISLYFDEMARVVARYIT